MLGEVELELYIPLSCRTNLSGGMFAQFYCASIPPGRCAVHPDRRYHCRSGIFKHCLTKRRTTSIIWHRWSVRWNARAIVPRVLHETEISGICCQMWLETKGEANANPRSSGLMCPVECSRNSIARAFHRTDDLHRPSGMSNAISHLSKCDIAFKCDNRIWKNQMR